MKITAAYNAIITEQGLLETEIAELEQKRVILATIARLVDTLRDYRLMGRKSKAIKFLQDSRLALKLATENKAYYESNNQTEIPEYRECVRTVLAYKMFMEMLSYMD